MGNKKNNLRLLTEMAHYFLTGKYRERLREDVDDRLA